MLQSKTKTEQSSLESATGCRYLCLLELKYFDPIRMLSIDPMHNLFLGTGRHMLHLWLSLGIVNTSHFSLIQEYLDGMVVPSDIGRIPHKVSTGFSGFTVEQFKNWITIYSIPALHDILPTNHLECWRSFVMACRILCKRKLTNADKSLFGSLLMRFCNHVEEYMESQLLLLTCTCIHI